MFFKASRGKRFTADVTLVAAERDPIAFELMTYDELMSSVGKEFIYDIEVYRNYTLIVFMSVENKKFCYFEFSGENDLEENLISYIAYSVCLIGFNSKRYDDIILAAILHGFGSSTIKDISDNIIKDGMRENDIAEMYKFPLLRKINSYDLKEVAPLNDSLKKYAARMHAKRLQELPYPEAAELTDHEKVRVREYCFVDNQNTDLLRLELVEQHKLRLNIGKQYDGIDLRSKSDAQIAEAVISSELRRITGYYPKKPQLKEGFSFQYKAPSYLHYQTPELNSIFDFVKSCTFRLSEAGSPYCHELAGNKERKIPQKLAFVNGTPYRLGIGGLHSCETQQAIVAAPGWHLSDIDFESFYPKMILNNEWFPGHLGRNFLIVFKTVVDKRLFAKYEAAKCKKAGDFTGEKFWKVEADSLKITINGSFGKLGSPYSILYAPDLMIQTTVTGQLTALMAIEGIETYGDMRVVSANTDGFIVHYPSEKRAMLERIVSGFEQHTNLKTEFTEYSAVYARDVNNYIAVKTDGEIKLKGVYSEKGSTGNSRLSKNPQSLIVSDALTAYVTKGAPIAHTVRQCVDLRRFLCVENVKGGAHLNGRYLGKTVRWIYGKGSRDQLTSVLYGSKVPDTDGAVPLMDLPDEIPQNLDFDRYINDAKKALIHIGVVKETASLF